MAYNTPLANHIYFNTVAGTSALGC